MPKFNSKEADEVHISLALYRIESKNVDLALSMNVPIKSSDGGAVSATGLSEAQTMFDTAASSMTIVDFGLFA